MNLKDEIEVYDKASISPDTGETEVWDRIIFPNVIRKRENELLLSQIKVAKPRVVLDFGCGTGHLLNFMRREVGFSGEYVGYDISEKMIETARKKFSGVRFEHRNIIAEDIHEDFDYILISGVFNNKIRNNWNFMTTILRCLFPHVQKGLAFNALSTYVDCFDPHLFYINPERVFRFCKEQLSPCIVLRHDYSIKVGIIPFEFTIYAYNNKIRPCKSLIGKKRK